ncbi:MAG: glycosyltransferase family 2 protein [Lachnospiraceae bacterium]|nr:glycosyltransferase family 2 protein [Lachnospiraceae bacterium]
MGNDNKEPIVSVIMPCYNTVKYMHKTLTSLFGQSLKDFEAVFVNDGSTDGTKELLEQVKAEHPDQVTLIHKENGGQSEARNVGLDAAKGKYIVFLDSDDYIDTDYLEVLVHAAEENNSEMVLSGQHKVDEYGSTIFNIDYPIHQYPNYALRRLNPHGKLYSREFLNRHHIRFAVGKKYEDNPFNLMAMFLCKNQVILQYNGHYQLIRSDSSTAIGIDPEKIPYDALEEAIAYVTEHKDLVADMDLFEFTVLSFMTYFIFQGNRKHIYTKKQVKGRKSDLSVIRKLCDFTKELIPKYLPKYYKNPHVGIFKERELMFSQRAGVWLFVRLLRMHLLKPFTVTFYRLF